MKNGPLLLFANPLETNVPDPEDEDVIYYGPGVHNEGEIIVEEGQTLYVAGGAYIKGGVNARGDNITIRGRGIISGLYWDHWQGPTYNLMRLSHSNNLNVEGVILKDSWGWNLVTVNCRDVTIDNVKIISSRCENNDGIDVCNSQNVLIKNCFIRSDDDCITTKGMGEWCGGSAYPPVDNVTVEKCVLWTDRAHIFRLGCECRAEAMRRLVFRDIDVLHFTYPSGAPAISVQPAEGMLMEDVLFENIRFNGKGQSKFIEITTEPTIWALQQTPGTVDGVTFRDLALSGTSGNYSIDVNGSDASHIVENVLFDGIMRYGQHVTSGSSYVNIGQYTSNIQFD